MLYRCDQENCKLIFNRPSKLTRHQNLHRGIRSYSCSEAGCSKSYSTPSHLKRHINSCHSLSPENKKQIFCCPFQKCDASFSTLWGLHRHEKKHGNSFHCERCNLFFKNMYTYERHNIIHENKLKCKCCKCGESFADKRRRNWIAHEKRCTFLNEYRESHTYECAKCGSHFQKKYLLQRHIRMCFNLPIRSCSVFLCGEYLCTKMFTYKRNLIAHVLRDHLRRTYSCSISSCCKEFKHKKSWLKHKQQHELKQ